MGRKDEILGLGEFFEKLIPACIGSVRLGVVGDVEWVEREFLERRKLSAMRTR
jgi:hypothetical protein